MAPVTGAREFGLGQPRAEPAAPQPAKGRSRANFLLHVDRDRGRPGGAGTGSAIFNTLRQVGGAVDGAVFGALLANSATFVGGMQISFAIAASMLLATAMVSSASGPPLMVWPASATPTRRSTTSSMVMAATCSPTPTTQRWHSSKSKIERELQGGCSAGQVRPPGGILQREGRVIFRGVGT
jgi:hypothetical protein